MILWRFKQEPETRGAGFSCTAFRWVLEIRWCYIGLTHQYQRDGKWHSNHAGNWGIGLRRKPRFGVSHVYYDGPHCWADLGFLWVEWGSPNCEKCMPEDWS